MAKYPEKTQHRMKTVMHEYAEGKLKSSNGMRVHNRKQAVAIGMSEARKVMWQTPKKVQESPDGAGLS